MSKRLPGQFNRSWYNLHVWQVKRRQVIKQAGGRCEVCGGSVRLEVHHKKPYRTLFEFLTGPFTVLCKSCHLSAHSKRRPVRLRARAAAMEVLP